MRKVISIALIGAICISITMKVQSQTMRDVFKQMPDSIIPSLTKNNRLDMIDFIDSKMDADVKNKFDEHAVLTILTDSYLHLKLSNSSSVELKLLPSSNILPDTTTQVVCLSQTLEGEVGESTISFYTTKWKKLSIANPIPQETKFFLEDKPDTMNTQKYNELLSLTDGLMVVAHLSPTTPTMVLTPNVPLLSAGQKEQIKAVLRNRELTWNGKTFK